MRWNEKYKLNVDLADGMVIDTNSKHTTNYGRQLHFFPLPTGYLYNPIRRIYMHQVVCGACNYNPRPKLFTVVDHISGDRTDNSPENLDHVNRHINNNNKHWNKKKHNTPPGVTRNIRRHGNWKFWTYYTFRKCDCVIKDFRSRQDGIEWALDFIPKYRNALKDVYLTSPDPDDNPDEWRAHFRKHFIPSNEFKKTDAMDVLALRRFPVTPDLYLKRTGAIIYYK